MSLEITKFGLIDYLALDFKPGFTVFTGETGAGKSIIINALQVALGGRAYSEYIKSDAEKALIQAIFEPGDVPGLEKFLFDSGLEYADGQLIFTRQLARSGRNICRINGQVITLQLYKQVSNYLLDMHGQHEQQSLLHVQNHMELLDRFGDDLILETKKEVAGLYKKWRLLHQRLEELHSDRQKRARQMDMFHYQIEEIDQAGLFAGEEEDLVAEKLYAANIETIVQLSQTAYAALYDGERGSASAVDQLGKAVEHIEKLVEFDQKLSPMLEMASSALYQLQEVSRELVSYRDGVDFQPGRLEEIETRLYEMARLKSKYGDSVEKILAYREQASSQLKQLEDSENTEEVLAEENNVLKSAYFEKAQILTGLRRSAAKKLKDAVEKELGDLGMKNVALDVKFMPAGPGPAGVENIEFRISANPGEPPKALAKIASGGELSRLMLAFKYILAAADQIYTLVFDEVDAGIGGETLQAVALKLERLSKMRQVIVVTHAAGIAALSDDHYLVHKESAADQTRVSISMLHGEKRIDELVRMLGGTEISTSVIDHARQLRLQKNGF